MAAAAWRCCATSAKRSWTQERLLEAGYVAAWMRYRAEVDYAYDKIGKLVSSGRQGRQLLNRGPLEYEDAIAIAEDVKTLPFIDPAASAIWA